jgi:nocardicin N-oxygenase
VRRAVQDWFTPAAGQRARPAIERSAARLLDRLVHSGAPADLVRGYAQPLALEAICDLLAVPAADRAEVTLWTDACLGIDAADASRIADAESRLRGYLSGLVEQGGTGLSGSDLSTTELTALAQTLLVAGYQTTANEIAGAIVALLRHPDQYRSLCSGRVPLERAVEELLRYVPVSASGGTIRIALADVPLDAVTVRAGEAVLPSTMSANRDAAVFADADRLDLNRHPNPHLAFGHGPHRCLGAHLARVELQVALGLLVQRLPRLRPAVPLADLPWETARMIRGPRALPVVWD